MTHAHSFLNSAEAQEDQQRAHTYEIVQARTERDLALMRIAALESLLKQYSNKIAELEMRIAMLEGEKMKV